MLRILLSPLRPLAPPPCPAAAARAWGHEPRNPCVSEPPLWPFFFFFFLLLLLLRALRQGPAEPEAAARPRAGGGAASGRRGIFRHMGTTRGVNKTSLRFFKDR